MREEGGTGAIVESVRAGLVMQLKEAVSTQAIMDREEKICKYVAFFLTFNRLLFFLISSPIL